MMDQEQRGGDRPRDRPSMSSGSLSEFDLGENYQSAVECLFQCQSLLRSQDRELAAKNAAIARKDKELARLASHDRELALKDEELALKDEELALKDKELAFREKEIELLKKKLDSTASSREGTEATSHNERRLRERLAAKDEQIIGLEEKLVQMSLELALAKTREGDQPQQANSHNERRLREQLSVKNDQISGLEEKLVQMSLELASAKANNDEQLHQFKRRMSGVNKISLEAVSGGGGDHDDDDDNDERVNCRRQQSQQQQPNAARNARRKPSSRRNLPNRGLSRSWSGLSSLCEDVDTSAWEEDGIETSCHSHPPPPKANLPSKEDPMEISVRTHPPGIGLGQRLSQLTQRRTSWTVDDAPSLDDSGRLDDSGKATLDESQSTTSSRRISSIGQFLLGLNRGGDGAAEREEGDDIGAAGAKRATRRGGAPITTAEIGSGVIFPVSSDDCLAGLDPARR